VNTTSGSQCSTVDDREESARLWAEPT
jgi:hypothetical protein